jgi:phosphoenolpyruvate-protein kinase (PTS system EI component)
MGANILSMNAGCISGVKRAIRNTSLETMKNVAETALAAATLTEVKEIMESSRTYN